MLKSVSHNIFIKYCGEKLEVLPSSTWRCSWFWVEMLGCWWRAWRSTETGHWCTAPGAPGRGHPDLRGPALTSGGQLCPDPGPGDLLDPAPTSAAAPPGWRYPPRPVSTFCAQTPCPARSPPPASSPLPGPWCSWRGDSSCAPWISPFWVFSELHRCHRTAGCCCRVTAKQQTDWTELVGYLAATFFTLATPPLRPPAEALLLLLSSASSDPRLRTECGLRLDTARDRIWTLLRTLDTDTDFVCWHLRLGKAEVHARTARTQPRPGHYGNAHQIVCCWGINTSV